MNKSIAIKVENLSKAYELGQIGTGTISRDLERFWTTKIRGKEDPYLKIGQTNDRTVKGESDIVWSLKDINFEIDQGDAVGIIGRNGAGKSTLLKLLSRVTSPTIGNIKVRGRIASLLEVGTGFHPELTGRENIYLNGSILGMRKKEITRKFDEIVNFSGVERYVDTPVKRYSSGMYVRLAFAVAAHLESEILIVDEVLAVGDAEFQKKCLGKMGEVSKGEGRTILFVSHNLAAVKLLCSKAVVLNNGSLLFNGNSRECIDYYIGLNQHEGFKGVYSNDTIIESGFLSLAILDKNSRINTEFAFDEPVYINIKSKIVDKHLNASLSCRVADNNERVIFNTEIKLRNIISNAGSHHFNMKLPEKFLLPNKFKLTFGLHVPNIEMIDYQKDCLSFEILETGSDFHFYSNVDNGCVTVDCEWQVL